MSAGLLETILGKPSAPAAPNPQATIAAQTGSNQQTATTQTELNDQNQITPYGSLSYSQTGTYGDGTPQFTATQSLSPTEQNLFNLGMTGEQTLGQTAVGALGNVQNTYASPINNSNVPQIQSSVNQFGGNTANAMEQAENAAYGQQTQYLNPQFAQSQEALTNSLINQGITPGSQAANTAQQNLGLQENQAYGNAANQAVLAGQGEQNTLFGQGLSNAGLANQASEQQLQQNLALYNEPLNTYNALMTGAQVQNPNFVSTAQTQVNPTNVAGITQNSYQDALQNYQQQMAGINNLFSLGGSLGSAAILA